MRQLLPHHIDDLHIAGVNKAQHLLHAVLEILVRIQFQPGQYDPDQIFCVFHPHQYILFLV